MRTQQLAIVLTAINLVLLVFLLAQIHRPAAAANALPVLRGRALEIVDEQGQVRAEVAIHPPTTVDGKTYPETVLLRLRDPEGRPAVKLDASAEGAGFLLTGDFEREEWSGVQLLAKDGDSRLKLATRDGREQVIQP